MAALNDTLMDDTEEDLNHTQQSSVNDGQTSRITREMVKILESFQQCRSAFVRQTAIYSQEAKTARLLSAGGASELLIPLLLDPVGTIRINAAISLGQLASSHVTHAEELAKGDTLNQLIFTMQETKDKKFKKAGSFIIRSIAKHNPSLAATVIEAGAVDMFVTFLTVFDPSIKEAGAWGLNYISRHNAELSQSIIDYGALPYLVQCVQEPDMVVKRIAVCSLADIAKHTPDLAQRVIEAGGVKYVMELVDTTDILLKRQITCFFAQIAKHSKDTANQTIQVIPKISEFLKILDSYVLMNSATFVGTIASHGKVYANHLVQANGVLELLTKCIIDQRLKSQYAACFAMGKIAACGEEFGDKIKNEGVIPALLSILSNSSSPSHIIVEAARCLGVIGSQSAALAKAVGSNSLRLLYGLFSTTKSLELKQVCLEALRGVISHSSDTTELYTLFERNTDMHVLEPILAQFAEILPYDATQRLPFIKQKKLELLQQVDASLPTKTSTMQQSITTINNSFPADAVKFYTPSYESELLKTIRAVDEHL